MTHSRLVLGSFAGLVLSAAFVGEASADALANTQPTAQAASATRAPGGLTSADSLTWNGITFYGTIDVGYAYQTHGASYNGNFYPGLNYLIAKGSSNSVSALSNNGLSQSTIGLKGDIPFTDDLSGVFKLDAGFNPLSLKLADGPKSLIDNNGRSGSAAALASQNANGDGGRAGQLFNGAAFIGVKSKTMGTLTFGRQNGLLADNVGTYDPQGGAYAFSVIGFSGATAGIGNTENTRLNSSLKYTNQVGPFRLGAQYQFSGTQTQLIGSDGSSGSATEINLGGDYGNFSGDLTYSQKNGAIAAGSLSPAQMLTLPTDSLTATISDTTSFALMGKYTLGAAKIFGGYERIEFANPGSPVANGTVGLGGYVLSSVNNAAYNNHKILDVYWTGVKYQITPKLDLTGAYYGYRQNSFAGNGCSNNSNSACSGTLNAYSIAATYNLMKHVDVYAGAMYSGVKDGLANGYLNATSTLSTMVGGRYVF